MTSKKDLSERDICTKYINPALEKAGWNMVTTKPGRTYLTNWKQELTRKNGPQILA